MTESSRTGVTGGGGLPDKKSTLAFRVVATASHHKYLNDAPRPHRLSVPSAHRDGSFAACQPAHRLSGLNVAPGRQLHPHCPRRCNVRDPTSQRRLLRIARS